MNEILTPCILQSIIICCTIIILCIIGLVAYGIKKRGPRDWASYIFAASVFLTIGIAIFSLCYCGDRNVLDFISLASAIISIILAVVTIVYSYFINSRSSGQIDQLNKAARDVSEATSSYTESAESLQENINKILHEIKKVKQTLDENNKNNSNRTAPNFTNFDLKAFIDGFIGNASQLGIMLLYACIKSKDEDKSFNLNEFGQDNAIYCYGFFIASVSVGFIDANIDYDSKKIDVNNYVNDYFKDAVNKWIDNHMSIQYIKETKDKIDNFFA